jgi:hypothetical protein
MPFILDLVAAAAIVLGLVAVFGDIVAILVMVANMVFAVVVLRHGSIFISPVR